MTRDKFEEAIDKISLDYPFRHIVNYLKDHDAEQRRVIEQQAQQIATLREALERVDSLVKWLCGEEGDFGSEPEPLAGKYRRAFWWRAELRKRYETIKQTLKETI